MLPRWGPNGNRNAFSVPAPTRLTVRDVPLHPDSRKELERLRNLSISARRVVNGAYAAEVRFEASPASLKELDRAALRTWLAQTFA